METNKNRQWAMGNVKWEKKRHIILAALLLFFLSPLTSYLSPVSAQTFYPTNQLTVAWDEVTVPSGTVSYKVYIKPEAGGTEALATTVTATQATVTFTQEGRYFLGVSSVRTVNAIPIESSTISWSNVAAVCQNGVTFGAQYYVPPAAPANFRRVP